MTHHIPQPHKGTYNLGLWRNGKEKCANCGDSYLVHSIRGGNCHITKCDCEEYVIPTIEKKENL